MFKDPKHHIAGLLMLSAIVIAPVGVGAESRMATTTKVSSANVSSVYQKNDPSIRNKIAELDKQIVELENKLMAIRAERKALENKLGMSNVTCLPGYKFHPETGKLCGPNGEFPSKENKNESKATSTPQVKDIVSYLNSAKAEIEYLDGDRSSGVFSISFTIKSNIDMWVSRDPSKVGYILGSANSNSVLSPSYAVLESKSDSPKDYKDSYYIPAGGQRNFVLRVGAEPKVSGLYMLKLVSLKWAENYSSQKTNTFYVNTEHKTQYIALSAPKVNTKPELSVSPQILNWGSSFVVKINNGKFTTHENELNLTNASGTIPLGMFSSTDGKTIYAKLTATNYGQGVYKLIVTNGDLIDYGPVEIKVFSNTE